jgi:hypothetical protein
MSQHHSILIVGGGSGGLSVAARLRNLPNPPEVTVIEPSEYHYYQPLWTLVGAGVLDKEVTRRQQSDYMPDGVQWLKTRVRGFEPEQNAVVTEDGARHTYDQLVVAVGISLDWHKIEAGPVERPDAGVYRRARLRATRVNRPDRRRPHLFARPTRSTNSVPDSVAWRSRRVRLRAPKSGSAIGVGSECSMHVVSPSSSPAVRHRRRQCGRRGRATSQSSGAPKRATFRTRIARRQVPPASRNAGLNARKPRVKPLVEPGGIEPPTSALPVRRSPS